MSSRCLTCPHVATKASSQPHDPSHNEGHQPRIGPRQKSGNRAPDPQFSRKPVGELEEKRTGAFERSGNSAREPETWSGDFEEGQGYTPFPANLPTHETSGMREESPRRTDLPHNEPDDEMEDQAYISFANRRREVSGPAKDTLTPDHNRNSLVSEPSALSDKDAPPWWVDLDEVFVLEFVASSSCEPVGLYVNRAEVHGVWRDIILGWEDCTDAKRHAVLLKANLSDPELDLQVQSVDPELLRSTAIETDHSCSVQSAGSLLMPPERIIGHIEDMRASLERSLRRGSHPGS